jgi:membrane protein implicated in regulation of membrane protease activity
VKRDKPGMVALPVAMAVCVVGGLMLALLAGPAWQAVAWTLLALPPATFALLLRRSS